MKIPQSVRKARTLSGSAPPGPWRRFFRELAGVALFNTAIAGLLWFVGFGDAFVHNLVFAQCIGIAIAVFVDGGRRAIWRDARPPMAWFVLLVVFGCAAGLVAGIAAGTALLGLPISMWRPLNGHALPVVLLVALIATAIASYHGWSQARISLLREETARQALREAAAGRQLVQAQLRTLQAQLEPHFLFNVLANLDSLIASDPARARHLLGHLNRFLRASLAATRASTTTLADEFALLEALLAIQQVRFGERLRYRFDLPDECRLVSLPPMLVQPLVENAVKHGVEPLATGATVVVGARLERGASGEQYLVLRVADDGAGFTPHSIDTIDTIDGTTARRVADIGMARPGAAAARTGDAQQAGSDGHAAERVRQRSPGIGLTNIRERLRVLYGDDARLTLSEGVPRGVVASLRLPVGSSGSASEAGF
ncbi:sensor histidine kinase [Pandoraea faecigallinarum]|uniref:sensor histidine kinase n=1 Tax=Pandoraea faecigallinarum TaxID=656179 RepID=UPI0014289B41|nr:histidine kinase [Pandoraea faecigallinarum]